MIHNDYEVFGFLIHGIFIFLIVKLLNGLQIIIKLFVWFSYKEQKYQLC